MEQLKEHVPNIQLYSKLNSTENLEEKPPTPGLKYRHYSPNAPVILFDSDDSKAIQKALTVAVQERLDAGDTVGIIHTRPKTIDLPASWSQHASVHVISLGEEEGFLPVAQGLFASLRDLDSRGVAVIFIEGVPERDEGVAIMNRVRKAASTVVHP